MLAIRWDPGNDYAGWIDLIPTYWLEVEGDLDQVHHFCSKGAEKIDCLVDVKIASKSILLNYGGRNQRWNEERDCDPGAMRIDFFDEERARVKSIWWAEDGLEFDKAAAKWLPRFEYAVLEGNPQLVSHLRRERDPFIVEEKKQHMLNREGKLACEACDFEFEEKYGELGRDFCEVHHNNPLKRGLRLTTLDDLAILCSNCHRMIHKTYPIEPVSDFRRLVSSTGQASRKT